MQHIDNTLAAKLGYKKIFAACDIGIVERPVDRSYILRSAEPGTIFKALGDINCRGVIFKGNELIKKTLEKAASNGKLVIMPVSEITQASGPTFMRNVYRLRSIFAYSKKSGAEMAIISLADGDNGLLSSMQMFELARFLGANETEAKAMLGSIGD